MKYIVSGFCIQLRLLYLNLFWSPSMTIELMEVDMNGLNPSPKFMSTVSEEVGTHLSKLCL